MDMNDYIRRWGAEDAGDFHEHDHLRLIEKAARGLPADIGRPDAWKLVGKVRIAVQDLDGFRTWWAKIDWSGR
jgi:hypothetical protein